MPSILISGANRGIGLEFVRQYAASQWRVFACCRNPEGAVELGEIAAAAAKDQVTVHALDIGDPSQIKELASALDGQPIDVLCNNAGVFLSPRERDLNDLQPDSLMQTLQVNTLGPALVTQAFLPNVLKSEMQTIVGITSIVGSIARNPYTSGGFSYAASKSASNAIFSVVASEVKPLGGRVLLFHPGWVQTDMGGDRAPVTAEQSVAGMKALIEDPNTGADHLFYQFDGEKLPW